MISIAAKAFSIAVWQCDATLEWDIAVAIERLLLVVCVRHAACTGETRERRAGVFRSGAPSPVIAKCKGVKVYD